MAVRRRTWKTKAGEVRETWVAEYSDQDGTWRLKTFDRKKDADAFLASTKVQVRAGLHVPDSESVTVSEAGEAWLTSVRNAGRERTTIDQYEQHLRLHILPILGHTKLSQLNIQSVRAFEDKLRIEGRSPTMIRYVLRSLSMLLGDAQDRGFVSQNVVQARRRKHIDRRESGKLHVGIDIPTTDEIRAILRAAKGRWRPLLMCATFAGLRSSELRGLRWQDVNFTRGEISVRQRADRYGQFGPPKSVSGYRTVPIPPVLVNTLREWKLQCPPGDLCFPNGSGNVENHANIAQRGIAPTLASAGVANKYGMHSFRHWHASWLINRRDDGGLELPLKVVQERLGHSSITMTADRYGHLFPRGDDGADLAAAANRLMG